MVIYAAFDGTIIWSDNKKIHKAGRVPLYAPLTVIREHSLNWFKIQRPLNLSLPAQEGYPDYWVYRDQILVTLPDDPDPKPDPKLSDADAADALITLLTWWRQEK